MSWEHNTGSSGTPFSGLCIKIVSFPINQEMDKDIIDLLWKFLMKCYQIVECITFPPVPLAETQYCCQAYLQKG